MCSRTWIETINLTFLHNNKAPLCIQRGFLSKAFQVHHSKEMAHNYFLIITPVQRRFES